MLGLVTSALDALKVHRKVATVVVCAGVAAAFYVQWQSAELAKARAETNARDLTARASNICEAVGVAFEPDKVKRADWGVACLAEARRLGRIEGDLSQGSLDVALEAMERQAGKNQTDAALAAALSKRAALAAERMEAENAAVENDRVGAGFACALNDLAGVPGPGC